MLTHFLVIINKKLGFKTMIIILGSLYSFSILSYGLFHYQYIRIPPMIWSSEILQKSLYLRNSKHCNLYVDNFK